MPLPGERPIVRRTFRRRLTVTMALLAVAVLAITQSFTYVGVRTALFRNLNRALLSIVLVEIASAVDSPGGEIHVHEELGDDVGGIGSGYHKVAQIRDENHHVLAQTANLRDGGASLEVDPALEARALLGKVAFADVRRGSDLYRGVYHPLRGPDGKRLVAIVALPVGPLYHSLDLLLGASALALVLGALASALAADRMARRLTRPLEEVASAARQIGAPTLHGRIPETARDVELYTLASVLNEMLARIDAAFAAQRRFVADASHELRSPLTNLRGTVEVALRQPRDAAEYREALGIVLGEAERLSRLVNELLTLSRADANQFALERGRCDLADVARAAAAAHAARARAAAVELRLEAQPAVLAGDAHRLREVVDNLLENALKYAPPGTEVWLRTRSTERAVVLSVEDAGPGLSPEERRRVFERFYRADGSRSRDSGGLGLGLAIVKAIVEAHGGGVVAFSEPPGGCRFEVTIPR